MGDHGFHPSGLLGSAAAATRALDAERWAAAEERTAELIACIQPNGPSEERRNAVAGYVQRLIAKCFSCKVFMFGSVPLKTYLPDGDIDLTAFSSNDSLKETWASEVRDALEKEERSDNAEFRVKEVQYIQAEVKLIKCLVENIVVDISFNQVGGLCTLCFLEEIDSLISQNHLFKRSIILIKAWCYYESRILGAHHGLISTYALETLVLYIFHVFNNSFAGPLEVLYRFLEFFSKFDWENFCVSLWGPVPISSLPDMTAEPPRKDSDGLLLSSQFLSACSTVYAVFPSGQENQGQSFVSKYFNVIDPLRTNNNLGRSVSKGNFFRIRSAFAFGAKRMSRFLECPKENLIAEVNQFFRNTWERHGSGNRPDAPISNIWSLRPSETVPVEEYATSRNTLSLKKKNESVGFQAGHGNRTTSPLSFHSSATQVINTINQHLQSAHKANYPSAATSVVGQRSYVDQMERSISSDASDQRTTRPKNSLNDQEVQGSLQFVRTRSSPELTEASVETLSRVKRNRVPEALKTRNLQGRVEYGSRQNNLGSEVSGGQSSRSSVDSPSALRDSSSHQSHEATSKSFHGDNGFANIGEELSTVSEALELQHNMQQEEQDLVNMMAACRVHPFNGQLQLPIHLASSHLSLPMSHLLASMGYSQRNLAGTAPNNFSFIDPSWGSGMQFPMSPYFPTSAILSSNPEDAVESANATSVEFNPENKDHGKWHDKDSGSRREFESDNGGARSLHYEEKKQASASGSNSFIPLSRASNSGAFVRGQQKFPEHAGIVRDNQVDLNSSDRYSSSSFVSVSQASSSRTKSSSESTRNGSSGKFSKSAKDRWGRRSSSSTVDVSMSQKSQNRWLVEGSSNHVSSQEEDDGKDCVSLSTMNTDVDIIPRPSPKNHQLPGNEVDPVQPVIVGNSHQRMVDNSGNPVTFYPTGPPVPFVTMLPIYNFPSDSTNHDNQLDFDKNRDEGNHTSMSNAHAVSHALKPDILNGDFASYWKNLQFGRLCQNNLTPGPIGYTSPATVPPFYVQDPVAWEGPGGPALANVNFLSQFMNYGPRLVPNAPPQPGPNRPSAVFHGYGDEPPRFRGGTGTYLPNPATKVPYRDRPFANSRNQRGLFDRTDHRDREGNWTGAKSRAVGRNHGRNQTDKSSTRLDRVGLNDNRPERYRESDRHDNATSHRAQSSAAVSSNGVGPSEPVVTMHPFDQGISPAPFSEPSLEFGSLGPVQLSSVNEVPRANDGNVVRRIHEQRRKVYRGTSTRSSPDQPSSPHIQRRL